MAASKAGSKKTKRARPRRQGQLRRSEPGLRDLMEQRDRLYDEARENPDSESGEMLRAFLLSGILVAQSQHPAAEPRGAELKIRELDSRLEEVARAAELAKESAAAGKPMDAMAVYNRIAEIVGLRSPLQPIAPLRPIAPPQPGAPPQPIAPPRPAEEQ